MDSLFKEVSEFQKFVRINISVLSKSVLAYEPDAREKYLLKYLGEELHDELIRLYNTKEYPDWADADAKKSILDGVLERTQKAVARLTLYLASPHMDLMLTEAGYVVTAMSNSHAPASAERVKRANDSYLNLGFDSIEVLLRYLEKYQEDIDSYRNSEAFISASRNYINTVETFDRIVGIKGSRVRFIELRPEMDTIESLEIDPMISPAMGEELRDQQRKGELTEPNKKLLDLVQRALAHLVISAVSTAEDLTWYKERMKLYGSNYLARIKQLLDSNADDYPAYKNSPSYTPKHEYKGYDNSEEGGMFVFGG
jgi:hypothetical protein